MSSNMERVAAMPDASLYVNRDGRRADDCSTLMVEARTSWWGVSWDFLFTVGSVSQDMDKNDGKVV